MSTDNKKPLTKAECDKEIKRIEKNIKDGNNSPFNKDQLAHWKDLRKKEFGDK